MLLKTAAAPVIKIPFVVITTKFNYLLNPVHIVSGKFKIIHLMICFPLRSNFSIRMERYVSAWYKDEDEYICRKEALYVLEKFTKKYCPCFPLTSSTL